MTIDMIYSTITGFPLSQASKKCSHRITQNICHILLWCALFYHGNCITNHHIKYLFLFKESPEISELNMTVLQFH